MAINYGHGWELLYKAISGMVEGNGDIKKRLQKAFIYKLNGLRKDELPPALWSKYSTLYAEVTSIPAVGDEGTIAASINNMTELRAAEVAGELFNIFLEQSHTHFAHT